MNFNWLSNKCDEWNVDGFPPRDSTLGEMGDYLERLLGSTQFQEFGFSWIVRRVETLSVLSANGEKRHLSLDIDAQELRSLISPDAPAKTTICAGENPPLEMAPIPFAIFTKGVLLDFSARLGDDTPLPLVQKSICWLAGYAWLLKSMPTLDNVEPHVQEQVYEKLWWICCHKPKDPQSKQLVEDKNGRLDFPHYWFGRDKDSTEPDKTFAERNKTILRLLIDETGYPTQFCQRLWLLSLNYFPMVILPLSEHGAMRFVLKADFLYGQSDEEWFDEKAKALKGVYRWPHRVFVPLGPWPYHTQLFGHLEGHCEHLHISLPRGVELVGGSWVRGQSRSLKTNIVDSVVTAESEEALKQAENNMHRKFFRNVLTIRRHASLGRGQMMVRFGLLPTLDGVFGPLMIALVALLGGLSAVVAGDMIHFWLSTGGSFKGTLRLNSGSVNVELLVGLVSGVVAVAARRMDQPLRARLLHRVYNWAGVATAGGVVSLAIHSFVYAQGVRLLSPVHAVAFVLVLVTWAIAFYAVTYLAWTLGRLKQAQGLLKGKMGITQQLVVTQPLVGERQDLNDAALAGRPLPRKRNWNWLGAVTGTSLAVALAVLMRKAD
ncbi:MAG: hypothetical protein LBN10_07720 [Propionibacteriaceae bacterium]|nr:hypothetical protein [Propionibacteriaceae bacterium]